MATRTRPGEREDALSRDRIVAAAVAMLDSGAELTFRALAARLRTGPGAIYWHVPNKSGSGSRCRPSACLRPTGSPRRRPC
jgi:AcrR family transcriptional regulator